MDGSAREAVTGQRSEGEGRLAPSAGKGRDPAAKRHPPQKIEKTRLHQGVTLLLKDEKPPSSLKPAKGAIHVG